jgi:predicted DNA-binding WGR domain protein
LDGVDPGRNVDVMQTIDAIHLHRIDPARNMARFYRMSSTPSLFGDICLVREWGRIGRPGRIRIDLYETGEEAIAAREALSRVKRQRGYRDAFGMGSR